MAALSPGTDSARVDFLTILRAKPSLLARK